MKHLRFAFLASSLALLAACVDTTGLSDISSRTAHPDTDPNSTVVIAEFADLQCPACRAAHTQLVKPLIQKYGKRIRYDFVHFPLRSLHRYALDAAMASECAADQNKFWEFVDVTYENQPSMNKEEIRKWAQSVGLDMAIFDRCVNSGIKKDAVMAEYDKGKEFGVTGTPTFFVNGQKVETDMETISKAIDAALQGNKPLL